MRSGRILVLTCAAPLVLTWLGCSSRALQISGATPPAGTESSPSSSSYTLRMMQLAERYEEQGNREGALRLYRQIVAADPGQTVASDRITAITGQRYSPPEETTEPVLATTTSPETQPFREITRPARSEETAVVESPLPFETRPGSERVEPRSMPVIVESSMPEPPVMVPDDAGSAAWTTDDVTAQSTPAIESILDSVPSTTDATQWWEEIEAGERSSSGSLADGGGGSSPDEPAWARTSLVRLCPDADEELCDVVSHLEQEDDEVRKEALMYLSTLGSEGTAASPAVEVLMDDPDELIRAHAAWASWSIGDAGGQSVTTLASLTASDDEDVIQLTAFFLGSIGADARDAEEALSRARDESSGVTRLHLAEALVRINPDDQVSLFELTRGLEDQDPATRWLSAVALTGISPDLAPWVVPALTARLTDSDPSVCSAAALTLGSLGPAAHLAVGPLAKATTHQEQDVRLAAEAALGCIQP